MGIKLVIVDDAPFMREVVRQIVIKAGIELVGEASNGVEAIKLVKSKKPDVILMDIVMPKMNGIEATKEILEEFPNTKIIACSTESQEDMVVKAIDSGCCNFVAKPFKSKELVDAIINSVK